MCIPLDFSCDTTVCGISGRLGGGNAVRHNSIKVFKMEMEVTMLSHNTVYDGKGRLRSGSSLALNPGSKVNLC
jgi:hypothetical protein